MSLQFSSPILVTTILSINSDTNSLFRLSMCLYLFIVCNQSFCSENGSLTTVMLDISNYLDRSEKDIGNGADIALYGDEQCVYSLRYEEFIAINTMIIQKLDNRVQNLEENMTKVFEHLNLE